MRLEGGIEAVLEMLDEAGDDLRGDFLDSLRLGRSQGACRNRSRTRGDGRIVSLRVSINLALADRSLRIAHGGRRINPQNVDQRSRNHYCDRTKQN